MNKYYIGLRLALLTKAQQSMGMLPQVVEVRLLDCPPLSMTCNIQTEFWVDSGITIESANWDFALIKMKEVLNLPQFSWLKHIFEKSK